MRWRNDVLWLVTVGVEVPLTCAMFFAALLFDAMHLGRSDRTLNLDGMRRDFRHLIGSLRGPH